MSDTQTTPATTNYNNLEINAGDDMIFLIDVSASMQRPGSAGLDRLNESKEKVGAFIAAASQIDTDGVSIYAFGEHVTKYPDVTAEKAQDVLSKVQANESYTNTHLAVQAAWEEHLERKNEQTFVLCITDGAPTNPTALRETIVGITNKIKDAKEFRITFLQVGDDAEATKALAVLDDELKTKYKAAHDIVDTKMLKDVDFSAALSGALND